MEPLSGQMSFAEDFLAKTSASPGAEPELTAPDPVFGPSSTESFAYFDRDMSSWRTSQVSLLEGLDEFSETWPRAGTTLSGTAYPLRPSAPRTSVTESSWLPTPTAQSYGSNQSPSSGAAVRLSLESMARRNLWPTPKASPSGPDYARANRARSGGDDLATRVARETPGQLNPTWVEWLMGWPLGWTDLKPLGTDKFRSWRQQHGDC